MMRFLLLLFCLMPLAADAHAKNEMPQYLKDLAKAYRSGDWVLQCDSARICRILGVVKKSGPATEVRAIVQISRGIEKNAKYFVRFAFVDDHGFVVPPPDENARLYPSGLPKMPPPLLLKLGAAEGDASYPQFRVSHDQGWRIVSALRRWPGAVLRNRGAFISRMPKGNLNKLLRKMDDLQPALLSRLTAAEESKWLKEYHYIVLRARPAEGRPAPDDVLLSCDAQTHVIAHEGWQVDENHIFWIAHCPEGAKTFMQTRSKDPAAAPGDYGPPVKFDVTDARGRIRPVQDASFDIGTSVLQLVLAKDGRWDCGTRLQYGFTDQGAFGVIEDRRMPMCRRIPAAYWLRAWSPTSWKLED
jgi:hypothetical protein